MGYYNDYGYNSYNSYNNNASSALGLVAGFGIVMYLIMMAIAILQIVSMWKVFKKAGKPGWAAIIPFYNYYVMCEIAGKEWWYILLLFVPIANIYAMYVIYDGIAKKFGKSTGFTIGMILAPFIFWPMLAFSKSAEIVTEDQNNNYMTQGTTNDYMEGDLYNQNQFAQNANTFNQVPPMQNMGPVNNMDVNNTSNGMQFNSQSVNSPIMQNTFNNSMMGQAQTGQTVEPINNNGFNNAPNGMQFNQQEPIMQNFGGEPNNENIGLMQGYQSPQNTGFDNNFGNSVPNTMQSGIQQTNEPVIQNSFDTSINETPEPGQVENLSQTTVFDNQFNNGIQFNTQPANNVNAQNQFDNSQSQTNYNDLYNNQNNNTQV